MVGYIGEIRLIAVIAARSGTLMQCIALCGAGGCNDCFGQAVTECIFIVVVIAVAAACAGMLGIALGLAGGCYYLGGVGVGMRKNGDSRCFLFLTHRADSFPGSRCGFGSRFDRYPITPAVLGHIGIIGLIAVAAPCTLMQGISLCGTGRRNDCCCVAVTECRYSGALCLLGKRGVFEGRGVCCRACCRTGRCGRCDCRVDCLCLLVVCVICADSCCSAGLVVA